MIIVKLNRADFEYDIHSLVKAFFPGRDVCVFAGEKKPEGAISFPILIHYGENDIEIRLYEGEDEAGLPAFSSKFSVDFSDRKNTKNRLKQELYKLLREYTGESLPWGTLTGIRPTKIPMGFLEEGREEEFIRSYMRETYFASEEKISLSLEVARRESELLHSIDYGMGYSLYIGIPFCPSTCLYCSFTSFPISMWEKQAEEYLSALEKEIDYTAFTFRDKKLNAVYIGGGTPTTLSPHQLSRLIKKIKSSFDLKYCLEFTVEAGRPDSITRDKLAVLREEGISRISINPQTMKEETLKIIGRKHTVQQTIDSFLLARDLGFDNINMDLILGLPNENIRDVENTMGEIKKLGPDNLTIHSLALKRGAKLKMFREEYENLTFENTWETIALTEQLARDMGLSPYYLYRQKNMAGNFENVGYALPGKAGVYNVLIMEEVQSIVALGAGSITKRVYSDGRIERCDNVKDVALYMERIDEMIDRKRKLFEDLSYERKES